MATVQGFLNAATVKEMSKRIALGQALSFLMSLTGVSTTILVNNNASYPLLQSVTSYAFIVAVYGPLYLFIRYKYRGRQFSNFSFMNKWWKYVILAVVDLEANYCVVLAYQYTNMMSVQLLDCFTVPCVLVLSYFILKMRFALTHILGCVVAMGGLVLLICLDADGLSRSSGGSKQVLGDCLCLLSSALYATSNVLTEWFIKPTESKPLLARESEAVTDERVADDCELTATCPMAVEDERVRTPESELTIELPKVPVHLPVVENLAVMSAFAVTFAIIQFFAVEWRTFEPLRGDWTGEDWLFQMVFGLTMLFVYTGMPTLFLLTSAAFTNISLLTADVYAIIWNVAIFKIYPTRLFFAAYIIIVVGILLYNFTDFIRIPFCTKYNYPCGDVTVEAKGDPEPEKRDQDVGAVAFGTRE